MKKIFFYFTNLQKHHLIVLIIYIAVSQGNCFAQTGMPLDTAKLQNVNNNPDSSKADTLQNSVAMFPGGNRAFARHLQQNLRMPEYYSEKFDIVISVIFTIEVSGKLKDFIASDGPKDFQKEAIRVIKTSGKWLPAYQDGKPVSSEQTQNIRFMRK